MKSKKKNLNINVFEVARFNNTEKVKGGSTNGSTFLKTGKNCRERE